MKLKNTFFKLNNHQLKNNRTPKIVMNVKIL